MGKDEMRISTRNGKSCVYLYSLTFFTIVKRKKNTYLVKIGVVVHEFHINPIPIESNMQHVDQNATAQDFVSYTVM